MKNDSERVKNLFEIFENAEMDIATTISLLDKVLGHSEVWPVKILKRFQKSSI